MTVDKSEKIRGKIKALLAKQLSAEKLGELSEAQKCANLISRLTLEYNISLDETFEQSNTTGERAYHIHKKVIPTAEVERRHESDWVRSLYMVLAKANYCRTLLVISRGGDRIEILGEEHNIETVDALCRVLMEQLRGLSLSEFTKYQGPEKRNTYRRGFLRGAVNGIREQLEAQAKEQETKGVQLEDGKFLPALVITTSKEAITTAINEFARNEYKGFASKSSARQGLSGVGGAARGREVGRNINLGKGIN
jgi:hypothetical protein